MLCMFMHKSFFLKVYIKGGKVLPCVTVSMTDADVSFNIATTSVWVKSLVDISLTANIWSPIWKKVKERFSIYKNHLHTKIKFFHNEIKYY